MATSSDPNVEAIKQELDRLSRDRTAQANNSLNNNQRESPLGAPVETDSSADPGNQESIPSALLDRLNVSQEELENSLNNLIADFDDVVSKHPGLAVGLALIVGFLLGQVRK